MPCPRYPDGAIEIHITRQSKSLSRAEELALSTINYQLSTINYQLKTPQQLSTINRDTHPDN
ncbi:MAG: hypothetical protein HC942_24440 [Microcoleus sp. SU_5_6]|nr:hypothetical protein [Microcoleus sp. SU_5_6]